MKEGVANYNDVVVTRASFVADALAVNEIAARPHNRGHVTIEGCTTSQFENHLRAVLDWPLGPTDLRVPAATMAKVLSVDDTTDAHRHVPAVLRGADINLHVYDKPPRTGRKIGHVTVTGADAADVRQRARDVARTLAQSNNAPVPA